MKLFTILVCLIALCGCAKINPLQTYNPYAPQFNAPKEKTVKERVDEFNRDLAEELEQEEAK